MVTPGVSRGPPRGLRWIAVGQVLLWSAIGLGAFLLLAKSVQNSAEFGRMQLWILLVDICGVVALSVLLARQLWRLVRDYRAHVPGLAPHGAHRGHLRRAGDRAAAHRLHVLARVHQPRHRQLVQGGGQAGPERCARACRAPRSTCACASIPRARWRSPRRSPPPTPPSCTALLNSERRVSQALEIALFGQHGRILAREPGERARERCPRNRRRTCCARWSSERPYVSLEPQVGGRYLIRTAAVLPRTARRAASRASWSRSTRYRRSSPRCPKPCRTPTTSTATSPRCASRSRTASASR